MLVALHFFKVFFPFQSSVPEQMRTNVLEAGRSESQERQVSGRATGCLDRSCDKRKAMRKGKEGTKEGCGGKAHTEGETYRRFLT